MLVYPGYHALFLVSPGAVHRLPLLLLPGLNLALKKMIVTFGSQLEDHEVVVDVSDTLYSTLCTVNSFLMVALARVAGTALSLYSMHKRSCLVRAQTLGGSVPPTVVPDNSVPEPGVHSTRNLVLVTWKLLQAPATLDSSEMNRIRLQSGVRRKVADETAALLRSLQLHTQGIIRTIERPRKRHP
ncbi:uncharacterized protein IUM83_02686 [Phytophthora cinnamomi]|uniref:uncharacterized protein n=1 Tax=Phytophthora cinnamomi TaxID=4785 RepID=UPI00355984CE|nr:hypothetical protein IUM83_02686 [Phytophthora cinnamomi]